MGASEFTREERYAIYNLIRRVDVDLQKAKECVLWPGAKNEDGYGRIGPYRAHRISYMTFNGPIPKGMMVCHTCDTPACVNPRHLFTGDGTDNIRDSYRKGRSRYRPPVVTTPKYNNEIVSEFIPYLMTRKMLAEKYGVSVPYVSYVLKRARKIR